MLHIVCEDKTVGFEFWQTINKIGLNGKAHMVTAKGKDNIVRTIRELSKRKDKFALHSGDTVFVAFDSVSSEFTDDIDSMVGADAIKIGYKYILSNYYCIEEVFLSFTEIHKWLNLDGIRHKDGIRVQRKYNGNSRKCCKYLKEVQRFIYTNNVGMDYFSKSSTVGKWYRTLYPEANTREQMSKKILHTISAATRKGFRVSDRKFGVCWFENCSNFNFQMCSHNDCYLYYLAKCKNKDKITGIIKLKRFWDRTICNTNMGEFSEFIQKLREATL